MTETEDRNPFRWWYCPGSELDGPCSGPEMTRDHIINLAHAELEPGDVFTIVRANAMTPRPSGLFDEDEDDDLAEWVSAASRRDLVLERFSERNEECWGEDGFEGHAISGHDNELHAAELLLEQRLEAAPRTAASTNAVFAQWFAEFGHLYHVWCFGEMRDEETLTVPEPAAAATEAPAQ